MDRRRRPARHSLPIDLLGGRSTWIAAALVVVVFLVITLGSNGPTEEGATEQDLLATVQTSELKEAAERVAFAQANVISVQNRLYVPPPIVDSVTTTTAPDLPAALADLVLQSRLSAVAAHPPIQFESGGDRITLESVPTLDRLAAFLAFEPTIRVQIIGHTDSDEKVPGDNLRLSAIRAEAVRTQLLARGVEPDRLVTLGLGHTDPIADNITKTGKAANRRIEFLLLRDGEVGLPAPAEAGGGDPAEADAGGAGSGD